jgi:hypothetical protein
MRGRYLTPAIVAAAIGALAGIAGIAGAVAREPAGPPADYKIDTEYTEKSPDGATVIEQYFKDDADNGYTWQFWVQRANARRLLDPKPADYPAGFRFTNDGQWVVRMQKTGAGYQDLYLYRLAAQGFVPATKKPISDLAWAYFDSRPETRKIEKPNLHIFASLVKGVGDNYKWLGETWPDSRYIVIGLFGDLDPNAHHGQILQVQGWRCRYDLKTGKFDVPADFAANNKKALVPQKLGQ